MPGSSTVAPQDGGSDVEERPFEGGVAKRKEEDNSTLPKAVAVERSSEATGITTDLDVFRALAQAGKSLAEIHVHYEQRPEYPLTKVEKAGEQLDYRVEKMKLSKDKTPLIYNKFLTLLCPAFLPKPTSTASVTALPSTGSSINTRSQSTNAAASPRIPTVTTTQPTFCA